MCLDVPNESENDSHADLLTVNLSLGVSMFSLEQTALAWDWDASSVVLSVSVDEPGGLDYADGYENWYH